MIQQLYSILYVIAVGRSIVLYGTKLNITIQKFRRKNKYRDAIMDMVIISQTTTLCQKAIEV